jgi:NADH-ubiquinone oxidoreductase chain 1
MSNYESRYDYISYLYVLKILEVIVFLVFILLTIAFFTLLERKVMSSIQRRRGPNRVGFFGLLQPFADGLKLLLKELIYTSNSNTVIFFIAPVFTFICTLSS